MTNLEIKQRIDENNSIIEQLVTPNKFTLNNVIYYLKIYSILGCPTYLLNSKSKVNEPLALTRPH